MSDYSIRLLKARALEVRELAAAKTAEEDQLSEREAALKVELASVITAHEETRRAREALREELTDLHHDIARLEEARPVEAPEPGPIPEKRDVRTRTPLRGLDRAIAERHEVEGRSGHYSRDPLSVRPQQHPARNSGAAVGSKRPRKYANPEVAVDLDKVSPTLWERAELAYEILQEAGGPLTQMEWGRQLTELLDCKPQTGSSIMTRCVAVLQTVKRVLWTGEHEGGSALWVTEEHASAELRAAAGLGTAEENYGGRTTRWPTPSTSPPAGGRITQESSAYGTNRRT